MWFVALINKEQMINHDVTDTYERDHSLNNFRIFQRQSFCHMSDLSSMGESVPIFQALKTILSS